MCYKFCDEHIVKVDFLYLLLVCGCLCCFLPVESSCPKDWLSARDDSQTQTCFKKFPRLRKTFQDAVSTCDAEGGYLARIRSVSINDALGKYVTDASDKKPPSYWIGLTGLHSDQGPWIWEPDVDLGSFTNWDRSEDDEQNRQDCAYFYTSSSDLKWYSSRCGIHRAVLCQRDSISTASSNPPFVITSGSESPSTTSMSSKIYISTFNSKTTVSPSGNTAPMASIVNSIGSTESVSTRVTMPSTRSLFRTSNSNSPVSHTSTTSIKEPVSSTTVATSKITSTAKTLSPYVSTNATPSTLSMTKIPLPISSTITAAMSHPASKTKSSTTTTKHISSPTSNTATTDKSSAKDVSSRIFNTKRILSSSTGSIKISFPRTSCITTQMSPITTAGRTFSPSSSLDTKTPVFPTVTVAISPAHFNISLTTDIPLTSSINNKATVYPTTTKRPLLLTENPKLPLSPTPTATLLSAPRTVTSMETDNSSPMKMTVTDTTHSMTSDTSMSTDTLLTSDTGGPSQSALKDTSSRSLNTRTFISSLQIETSVQSLTRTSSLFSMKDVTKPESTPTIYNLASSSWFPLSRSSRPFTSSNSYQRTPNSTSSPSPSTPVKSLTLSDLKPTTQQTKPDRNASSIGPAVVAGSIVGAVAVIALLFLVIAFFLKRHINTKKSSSARGTVTFQNDLYESCAA